MMLVAGPKPFKAPTTRQKGFAYRAGEQGCMYHIWAVQCQIQLCRAQESDHNQPSARSPAARCRLKFADSLGSRLGCVQKGNNLVAGQGRLGFAETRRHQSGLAGDRQCIEDGLLEQPFGAVNEVRGQPNVALEPADEGFAFNRLTQGVAGGGHPDAAARKLVFDIRDRFPIRPDHKPDQVRNRPHLTGGCAQTLPLADLRSAIELVGRSGFKRGYDHTGFVRSGLHLGNRHLCDRRWSEVGLLNPARLQPRLHDKRFRFLARNIKAIENAGFAH